MLLLKTSPDLLAIFEGTVASTFFWILFGLLGLWMVGKLLWKSWRYTASRILQHQLHSWISRSQAKAVFEGYVPRLYLGKRGELIPLVRLFLQEIFPSDKTDKYVLLGEDGAGKTTFLLRLFVAGNWKRKSGAYRIQYVHWQNGACQSFLENCSHPERTILLMDGIDECSAAYPNYKQHLDQIFFLTKPFAKTVIALRKGYLPKEIEGDRRTTSIHFIGESCYELLGKIELPAFAAVPSANWRKQRKRGQGRASQKRIRDIIRTNPHLSVNPGLIRMLAAAPPENKSQVFTAHCVSAFVHQEIGRITTSPEQASELFAVLNQLAAHIYEQYLDGKEQVLTPEQVSSSLSGTNISHKQLKKCLLLDVGREKCAFRHLLYWSYFVAWHGFHKDLLASETQFFHLPIARKIYQEICWDKFLNQQNPEEAWYRVSGRVEKKPLTMLSQPDVLKVNRLYLSVNLQTDARFLRNLQCLEAVHFLNSTSEEVPVQVIDALPDQKILLQFHKEESEAGVYHFQEKQAELWIEEDQTIPIRARSLVNYSLGKQPNPRKPLRYPGHSRPASRGLLELFDVPLPRLKRDSSSREIPMAQENVQAFERMLGMGELELFDKVEVIDFADTNRNLIFSNRYNPTLLIQSLEQIVNDLYLVMGEDDEHMEMFRPEDEAQIEDGFWVGRKWTWKNTDSYPYAVQLYMAEPGKVILCIWGIEIQQDDMVPV